MDTQLPNAEELFDQLTRASDRIITANQKATEATLGHQWIRILFLQFIPLELSKMAQLINIGGRNVFDKNPLTCYEFAVAFKSHREKVIGCFDEILNDKWILLGSGSAKKELLKVAKEIENYAWECEQHLTIR